MVKIIACNLLLQAIQPAKTQLPFNKVFFWKKSCECSMQTEVAHKFRIEKKNNASF